MLLISYHLKNIFLSSENQRSVFSRPFAMTGLCTSARKDDLW